MFHKFKSLQINLLAAMVGSLIITVSAILVYSSHNHSHSILGLTHELFGNLSRSVINKTQAYLRPPAHMVRLAARLLARRAQPLGQPLALRTPMIRFLRTFQQQTMFYVGDERGSFVAAYEPQKKLTRVKVLDRRQPPARETFYFYNDSTEIVRQQRSPRVTYDPRLRPWYRGAKEHRGLYWSDTYIFHTSQRPGISVAYPIVNKKGAFLGAVGADIELGRISEFLSTLTVGRSGAVYLTNSKGELIGYKDKSRLLVRQGSRYRPARIDELGIPWLQASYRHYKKQQRPRFTYLHDDNAYIAAFVPFPRSFGKDWRMAIVVPEDDFLGHVKKVSAFTILFSLAILLLSIFFAIVVARNISRPIQLLTEETGRIQAFQLDQPVQLSSSIREVQLLIDSVGKMKQGLCAFGKYVPSTLVRKLIQTGEDVEIGGKKKDLTILFSDVASFTTLSEEVPPEDLLHHLSNYFDNLSLIIMQRKGTIDKYIGDAIMAFWGAPLADEEHAIHACEAVLDCNRKVRELNEAWEAQGLPPLPTRFGLHTGETIVGNMGSRERMNYTILGDSVNIASRLEALNKLYQTSILVSAQTCQIVQDRMFLRPVDIVVVKGRKEPIQLYELLDQQNREAAERWEALCAQTHEVFDLYLRRQWSRALTLLEAMKVQHPQDPIVQLYLRRCRDYRLSPPPDDWQGIVYLHHK